MKDYILGVDLGGTNIKAAAYRLESYEKVGEKRPAHPGGGRLGARAGPGAGGPGGAAPANAPGAGALRGYGRARPAGWWRAMPWPSPGRGAKSSPPSWGTPPGCWGPPSTAPRRMGEGRPDVSRKKKFPVLMFFSCCGPILDGIERDTGPL